MTNVWVISAYNKDDNPDSEGRCLGVADSREKAEELVETFTSGAFSPWYKSIDGDGLMKWDCRLVERYLGIELPTPPPKYIIARCWEVNKPLGKTVERR